MGAVYAGSVIRRESSPTAITARPSLGTGQRSFIVRGVRPEPPGTYKKVREVKRWPAPQDQELTGQDPSGRLVAMPPMNRRVLLLVSALPRSVDSVN